MKLYVLSVFQAFDNASILKLVACTFSFSSNPEIVKSSFYYLQYVYYFEQKFCKYLVQFLLYTFVCLL